MGRAQFHFYRARERIERIENIARYSAHTINLVSAFCSAFVYCNEHVSHGEPAWAPTVVSLHRSLRACYFADLLFCYSLCVYGYATVFSCKCQDAFARSTRCRPKSSACVYACGALIKGYVM